MKTYQKSIAIGLLILILGMGVSFLVANGKYKTTTGPHQADLMLSPPSVSPAFSCKGKPAFGWKFVALVDSPKVASDFYVFMIISWRGEILDQGQMPREVLE